MLSLNVYHCAIQRLSVKYLLFTIFLSFNICLVAQQAAQYTLIPFNVYAFNPAYAGMDASLNVTGVYRNQWSGLNGNPSSRNLNAHLPIYFLSSGAGVYFESESLGAETNLKLGASFNYVVNRKLGLISIGIRPSYIQKTLDGSILISPDGEYEGPVIDHMDPILPNNKIQESGFGLDAGIFISTDYFDFGVSANNIIENEFTFSGLTLFHQSTSFELYGNTAFDITQSIAILPYVFYKTDLVQHQIDIGTSISYEEMFTAGAGFRGYDEKTIDAVTFHAGVKMSDKLSLYYSYDLTLNQLASVSTGTHELVLQYNLNKRIGAGEKPRVIYNPRFF